MIGLLGGVIGSVFSAGQMIQGGNEEKAGEYALDMFERQDLTNTYNDIGISTYGSDLIREENARNSASMIDAARSGGTRGIMGMMGRVQANNNLANAKSVADLDGQDIKRRYSAAQDNVRIQQMQEQRDNMELDGIGQMINNGKQKQAEGQRGLMNSFMMGANSMGGGGGASGSSGSFGQFSGNSFGGSQVGGATGYSPSTPSF
jgi:hypothetical protein